MKIKFVAVEYPTARCSLRYEVEKEYIDLGKSLKDLTPFINSVYADNGQDYVHISIYDGHLGDSYFKYFDVTENGNQLTFYFYVKIALMKKMNKQFIKALDYSGGMVQVELKFRDHNGKDLESFVSEVYGKETKLIILDD